MITLTLIIYVIFSIYFSIQNMRGYVGSSGYVEPKRPKHAIIEGFLTLPLLTLAVIYYFTKGAVIGMIIVFAIICAIWIMVNMP